MTLLKDVLYLHTQTHVLPPSLMYARIIDSLKQVVFVIAHRAKAKENKVHFPPNSNMSLGYIEIVSIPCKWIKNISH